MKKNNFLKGMSAIAILSAAGVAAIAIGTNADIQTKALDANQFIHYKGLAATCEQDGVTDYYTNCYDATYTELPEGATVVQKR